MEQRILAVSLVHFNFDYHFMLVFIIPLAIQKISDFEFSYYENLKWWKFNQHENSYFNIYFIKS